MTSEQYAALNGEIVAIAELAHEIWARIVQLQEQEAMARAGQLIQGLQRLVSRQPELVAAGVPMTAWSSFFGCFPVLLQAMETKDYLRLADILEYELRPQLDSFALQLNKHQRFLKSKKR